MKKIIFILLVILLTGGQNLPSQEVPDADVYLITCGPGTETYSIYGHSALRIVIPEKNSDLVYNWGVFDFSTPSFAWKFAKGRLDYMLGVYPYQVFLEDYNQEQRWVISQKINLLQEETWILFALIAENLKPENISYRYDFFYDDCSTRIRDILEKAIGNKLLYPPDGPKRSLPTFRDKVGEYQRPYPWMKLGIDLLMGSPGDRKASFRDVMFLPVDLKNGLSAAVVNRAGKMVPLLQDPEIVLNYDTPVKKAVMFNTPIFVFTLLIIAVIILTAVYRGVTANNIIDISIFSLFSVLALMMIFFNFFTDHQQMKWNLNIIWLNPAIIVCLASLLTGRHWQIWFQITFFLAAIFLVLIVILPQEINNAFVPLIITLIIRSSIRSGFSWNPLTLPHLT